MMVGYIGSKWTMYTIKNFRSLKEREEERPKLEQCADNINMDVDNASQNLSVIERDIRITGAYLRNLLLKIIIKLFLM